VTKITTDAVFVGRYMRNRTHRRIKPAHRVPVAIIALSLIAVPITEEGFRGSPTCFCAGNRDRVRLAIPGGDRLGRPHGRPGYRALHLVRTCSPIVLVANRTRQIRLIVMRSAFQRHASRQRRRDAGFVPPAAYGRQSRARTTSSLGARRAPKTALFLVTSSRSRDRGYFTTSSASGMSCIGDRSGDRNPRRLRITITGRDPGWCPRS